MLRSIYGWIALAVLSVGTGHAAEPPAPTRIEQAASVDDVDRAQAYERWRKGFDVAMVDHARTLAVRGDARSLLAAALIVPVRFDQASGERLPSAVDPQPWFDAARAKSPADPLVAWLEATGCVMVEGPCDPDAAIARLLQVDGGNAAVQWLAIGAALRGGDRVAAHTHLRLAAQADRFEPYVNEVLGLLLEARAAAPMPPMDPDTGKRLGVDQQFGRPASNQDMIAMVSFAQWAAISIPPLAPVAELCHLGEDTVERDAALQQDCTALMALLADDDSTMIFPALALPALVQLSAGPQRAQWRSRLRDYAWLSEQARLMAQPERMAIAPLEYARWIAADGELGAMRRLLQHHGIALQPPAGWLPQQPRYRALIDGNAPAD